MLMKIFIVPSSLDGAEGPVPSFPLSGSPKVPLMVMEALLRHSLCDAEMEKEASEQHGCSRPSTYRH